MNRVEARRFMFDYGREAWAAAVAAVLPAQEKHAIRFQGVTTGTAEERAEPQQGTFWCRVSMQVVYESQETLRNGEVRRFCTVGNFFVQIFAPNTHPRAQVYADRLAEHIRNTMRERGVDDNLEFTRAAIDDTVAREPAWLPVNVAATFAYRQYL